MSIDKQDKSSNTAQINVDDKSINLDMTYGTMGLPGINIKPLMAEGYSPMTLALLPQLYVNLILLI